MDFGHSFFQPIMGNVEQELDKRLLVGFYAEEELDEQATAEKGEDVYRTVEYIKIFQPGGGDEVERRVTPQDRERFADRYEKFLKKQEQRAEGFPIEQWGGMHRAMAAEYRKQGIDTLEQLCAVTDASAHRMPMGFTSTRAKAQAFLDMRKDSAAMERLAAENNALHEKLAALSERLSAMEQAATEKV